MKQINSKYSAAFYILFLACSMLIGASKCVFAQQKPVIIKAPAAAAAAVKNLIAGYGEAHQNPKDPNDLTALFVASPDAKGNNIISALLNALLPKDLTGEPVPNKKPAKTDSVPPITDSLTAQGVFNLLTTADPSNKVAAMSQVPGPLRSATSTDSQAAQAYAVGGTPQKTVVNTDAFNLNTLLLPLKYDVDKKDQQNKSALNFIQFVTGQALPDPLLPLRGLSDQQIQDQLQNNSGFQQYLVALRIKVAAYSIAMSNLYQLYSERMPQDIKKVANLPGLKDFPLMAGQKNKASVLQVDNYIATRRVKNQKWYQKMEKATPATLQREIVYELADLLYVTQKDRMLRERTLATLSAMEVQSAETNARLSLTQLQLQLSQQKPFKSGS